MTKVIAAFPGTGKSYFFRNSCANVLDVDLSNYLWIEGRIRHPDYPYNYIADIRKNIGNADIMLVSLYPEVRELLMDEHINHTLVFPQRSLKEEYLNRYKQRGSPENFVDFLSMNWDKMISDLEDQPGDNKIRLQKGQYLSDIL